MNRKSQLPPGLESQGEIRALLRARQEACQTAARTGTPLVILRDGKIELVPANESPALIAGGIESSAHAES